MFGRDQDECDNGVDSYMFQFGEEEVGNLIIIFSNDSYYDSYYIDNLLRFIL